MLNINEMLEKEIYSMAHKIVTEELQTAIEELTRVKAPEKEFYSIKDAAYILSITESGLKSRGKSGKIELIYDQNNITIHRSELDRYKKKNLYKQMKNKP